MTRIIESEDILKLVTDKFGITDKAYYGPTFILPNGYFLDLRGYKNHSDVEKWLIDNNLSKYEYIKTGGSPTLYNLNCIRCDMVKYYITLPEDNITREQYNTLLLWLDELSKTTRFVEVIAPNNQSVLYNIKDEITDYVVDRIRRYYSSGKLYEQNDISQKHQFNFKYKRHSIGNKINYIKE